MRDINLQARQDNYICFSKLFERELRQASNSRFFLLFSASVEGLCSAGGGALAGAGWVGYRDGS